SPTLLLHRTTPSSWPRKELAGATPSPTSPRTPAAGTSATSTTGVYGKPCPQSYSQVSASHAFVSPSSILPDPFFSLQSVAYTAVPLFVMAVVWFVGFGAVLLIISC